MKLINFVNNNIARFGAQITRYPDKDLSRRIKLLTNFRINKVFDVGANVGNYGIIMRKSGFTESIISFEPLQKPFQILKKNTLKYKNWSAVNIALGDQDEETVINVAGNYDSSSLLDMLPNHLSSAPDSAYIGKETIQIAKIDTIFGDYYREGDNIFLKIDTQGFEKQVLNGASKSLAKLKGIQMEMSLIPLYKDSALYNEMIEFLRTHNFALYSIENGFSNPQTGQLLQFDGIFFKTV